VEPARGERSSLPPELFRRQDENPDALFYAEPRLVEHIDDATIAALTDLYRQMLPAQGDVLDLMSSWVSHLPPQIAYRSVTGLGMNAAELEANRRLDARVVHDLNAAPELPFPDASFDAVVNCVSIQYLVRPLDVFRSVARVLRPGGLHLIATSHRCFPTKAIAAFFALPIAARLRMIASYFELAGGYAKPEVLDRSPAPPADPLWIVHARRAPRGEEGA
jgi:SAM-dependent methyltransferase